MAFIRPKFKTFTHEHKEVINNEAWYNDGPPLLAMFSAAKTTQRHHQVIGILRRAAKREIKAGDNSFASALRRLTDKLAGCKPGFRCGSLARPQCARAFQRAKVAGQRNALKAGQKPNVKNPGDGQRHTVVDDIHQCNWTSSTSMKRTVGFNRTCQARFRPRHVWQCRYQPRRRVLPAPLAHWELDLRSGCSDKTAEADFPK